MGNPIKRLGVAVVTLAGAATAARKVLRRDQEPEEEVEGPEPGLGPSMAGTPDEAVEWLPDQAPKGDPAEIDEREAEASADWEPPDVPDFVAARPVEQPVEQAEPEPPEPPEPEPPEPPEPEPPELGEPEPVEGVLDINAATFEQLRGLGLSVTLAKRIIALRDEAGGFSSLDELDAIRGISMTTRAELHERLRV